MTGSHVDVSASSFGSGNMKLILVSSVLALALSGPRAVRSAPVFVDPLKGSTTGTRSGGKFVAGGWQVTGKDDTIYWHLPTIARGAVEFDVCGFAPNESRPGMQDKSELFHMYDHTVGGADGKYLGGYHVINPLTGVTVSKQTLSAGERYTMPQGPGTYICRGRFLDAAPTRRTDAP